MVVGLSLVPAALVLLIFTRRMWKIFWPAFRSAAGWTRDALIWLVAAGLTVVLDKARQAWPLLGLGPRPTALKAAEESLELALGGYTILLLWPLWRQVLVPEPGEGPSAR